MLTWIDRLRDTGRPLGAQPWESDAERHLDGALTVGYELPRHPPVERSALAAELLNGDAHALDDDRPVARLLMGQLAVRAGLTATPRAAAEVRVLWQRFGVLCDSASATVLALNLAPVPSTPLAQAIGLMHGQHVALTLGQLQRTALRFAGCAEAFLCENPTVLLRIESELGARSPALVCTGGWPNGAVCTLLDQLRCSSVVLRHHGDFDWAGLEIFAWLRRHYGVTPWRFDRPSYEAAVQSRSDRLATLEVERAKFSDDDALGRRARRTAVRRARGAGAVRSRWGSQVEISTRKPGRRAGRDKTDDVRRQRQDALVIALHAVWSRDSRLCLWGEDRRCPPAPRRRAAEAVEAAAAQASVRMRGARPGWRARAPLALPLAAMR